jgi:large subunit ribosomal protein L1
MAGKKYRGAAEKIDRKKRYTVEEACELLPKVKVSKKMDETVDVAVRLGVDPKHADQMVRGAVVLPNGTGKSKRVLVIAKPDKAKEALEAGADFAGGEEYIKKIQEENWFEFDSLVATPDMMGTVGKIGRVLGPRGQGGARAQGRPGRVPGREGGHRPLADRQGVVHRRSAGGQPARLPRGADEAQALDREGDVHAFGHHLDHPRSGDQDRPADRGGGEGGAVVET